MEGAAALILPGACNCRDRRRRVHIDRTIALACEAIAEPEEGLLRRADQPGEFLDLCDRQPGDRGGPFRCPRLEMRLQPLGVVGIFFQIVPISQPLAEKHMHDRAGQRPVGAGPHHQRHVGLLHRGVVVDVDHDDLRAAFLAGLHRMGHHVDLGGHRVGAPDHHAIGLGHLAWIRTGKPAGTHHIARPGEIGADGGKEA